VRCFLAIELTEATIVMLESAGSTIRALDPAWVGEKWVSPGVMHVTLKFLGELDVNRVERIVSALTSATASHPPFSLRLASVRAVPRPERASMLWAVLEDPTGGCRDLAKIADNVAVGVGLEPDSRPFAPHITIVRARRPRAVSADALSAANEQCRLSQLKPMSVVSATLFSSVLTPQGPIHERLALIALGTEEGRS
jgi:2'-5' RNA ligase